MLTQQCLGEWHCDMMSCRKSENWELSKPFSSFNHMTLLWISYFCEVLAHVCTLIFIPFLLFIFGFPSTRLQAFWRRQSVHFYLHASCRRQLSYKESFTKPKKREIGNHYQWWKGQVKLAWRTRSKLFSRRVLHTTNPELRRQFSLSYISSSRSVWATEDLAF